MIQPLQKGSTAVIEMDLTHPVTKAPLDHAKSTVKILLRKPGATVDTEPNVPPPSPEGHYEVPVELDTAGVWHGHLVVTGEYKKKLPFRFEVGDD